MPLDLVAERQLLAPRRARQLEGVAQRCARPRAGEHRRLDAPTRRRCPRCRRPPISEYSPSLFSRTIEEVESPGPRRAAGEAMPGQSRHRAQVDVLVEVAADRHEQAPQRDVVGHAGEADRAQEDRVEVAQCVEPVVGHHRGRSREVLAAPVVARRQSIANAVPRAAASSTRSAAGMTSWPMPSPGMTAIAYRLVALTRGVLSRRVARR